jgi:ribonuclease HI
LIEALLGGRDLEAARKGAKLSRRDVAMALSGLQDILSPESGQGLKPAPVAVPADIDTGLELTVFTDGASRGNPGESACAVIFYNKSGEELLRRTRRLGRATNNVAEYEGLVLALELASQLKPGRLVVKLDSELVVKQMNREYKVKDPRLAELHRRVSRLAGGLPSVGFEHISRKENKKADSLVNAALDGKAEC